MLKTTTKSAVFFLSLCFTTTVMSDDSCEKKAFPTAAIADYVLGCMVANGNTLESLHQCSCSIDLVMERMSYHDFEQANTVMQIQRDKGQRGVFYREAKWAKKRVEVLEQVQAESTLTCFN